jgi:hypothetical protein
MSGETPKEKLLRLRRLGLASVVVAASALVGTACHPTNEVLAFGISRSGGVSADGHSVTLGGTVACDYQGTVRLFMSTTQGFSPDIAPSITCSGPELQQWVQTFQDSTVQPKGATYVTIEACTDCGGHSEDSMTVTRTVFLA